MRSLPEIFESKVTDLEENSDYTKMKPSEVIGRLLAYESRKAPTTTPLKKQKSFALKTIKVEKEEENLDEEIALMTKKFKQFMRFDKKGFGSKGNFVKKKTHFKKVEQTQEKDHKKGVQCYECSGYEHIAPECANLKKKKGKALAVTWSDSDDLEKEDKSSDDDKNQVVNFIAFLFCRNNNEVMSDKEGEEDNKRKGRRIEDGASLGQKSKESLKRELIEAKRLIAKMTSRIEKLDKLLSCGKSPNDKKGLGYMEDMETTSLKNTTFVKSKEIEVAQTPEQSTKWVEVGECSKHAQAKAPTRALPQ
ncbi:hypothetical protein Q3G72_027158 [Acer saccharum]|nr:hypothetical protein Q3G72_027158 [Acer saccharum]